MSQSVTVTIYQRAWSGHVFRRPEQNVTDLTWKRFLAHVVDACEFDVIARAEGVAASTVQRSVSMVHGALLGRIWDRMLRNRRLTHRERLLLKVFYRPGDIVEARRTEIVWRCADCGERAHKPEAIEHPASHRQNVSEVIVRHEPGWARPL